MLSKELPLIDVLFEVTVTRSHLFGILRFDGFLDNTHPFRDMSEVLSYCDNIDIPNLPKEALSG